VVSALSHPSSKLPGAEGGDVQQVPADDSLHGLAPVVPVRNISYKKVIQELEEMDMEVLDMSDNEVLDKDKVITTIVYLCDD
jgi:hypothetical protein